MVWIVKVLLLVPLFAFAAPDIIDMEQLIESQFKPFVVIEAQSSGAVSRAQGVVVSEQGDVLSAAHVSWIDSKKTFVDDFRISFRSSSTNILRGYVHKHKTTFSDKENAIFYEYYFNAKLQRNNGSRFLGANSDVALFKIAQNGNKFPVMRFYSKGRPKIRIGDVFYLCHYTFPHKPANPTLLINPVEVVGVVQTSSGLQYLAQGYYRIGSSGGAILKDGRLIGIQSAAYTINSKENAETTPGLISFHSVWEELIEDVQSDDH